MQLHAASSDLPGVPDDMANRLRPWPVVLAMVLHQLMAAAGWDSGDADQQVPPNTPGMPHRPATGASQQDQRHHDDATLAVGPAVPTATALRTASPASAPGGSGHVGHEDQQGPTAGLEPTPTPSPLQAVAGHASPAQQQVQASRRRNLLRPQPSAAAAAARRQATQRVLVYALSQWSPLLLKACGLSDNDVQYPPTKSQIHNPGPIVAVLLHAVPAVAASLWRATTDALAGTSSTPKARADCGSVSTSGNDGDGPREGAARVTVPGLPEQGTAAAAAASWRVLLLHDMRALRLMVQQLDRLPGDSGADVANGAATHFGRLYEPLARALLGLVMAAPADLVPYMASSVMMPLCNVAAGLPAMAGHGGISPSAIGSLRVVQYAEQHPEMVSRGNSGMYCMWSCGAWAVAYTACSSSRCSVLHAQVPAAFADCD